MIHSEAVPVRALDVAAPDEARELLRPCCASGAWLAAMTRGRPYGTLDALIERSDGAIALLDWPDVEEALAGHPRIGQRASGSDQERTTGRSADEMYSELRERLGNGAETERGAVRGELAQIVRLRLAKAFR